VKRFPRAILRGLVNRLVLIVLCGLVLLTLAQAASAAGPPNVLVILTDDQRAETMGVMPKTLRLFGRQGRTFPRAFVTTPLCCPSRASILTGRFAHNHGIEDNGTSALAHDTTLQRYLSDAGYQTGLIGKFLNSWRLERTPPYFQRWALMANTSQYYNTWFNVDGTMQLVSEYVTSFMTRKSVAFLRDFEQNDAQPWFLYISTRAPHAPAIPAPRYETAFVPPWALNPAVREEDRSDKPQWVRMRAVSLNWLRELRADQLRTLISVDDLVARVFAEMKTLGEKRRTLAVFMSDNGFMWGEHGLVSKRYPYTDSIKIPLHLRWPGHVSAGSTDRRFATNVDIAPTVLSAAGIAPTTPMDGRSLLEDWNRRHLFTEYWVDGDSKEIPGWDSIRTKKVHYIRYYNDDRSKVIYREYYRLTDDPWELRNLLRDGIATNNPNTAWLNRLIGRYRSCVAETCP